MLLPPSSHCFQRVHLYDTQSLDGTAWDDRLYPHLISLLTEEQTSCRSMGYLHEPEQ